MYIVPLGLHTTLKNKSYTDETSREALIAQICHKRVCIKELRVPLDLIKQILY
jgi:hypothetical protein